LAIRARQAKAHYENLENLFSTLCTSKQRSFLLKPAPRKSSENLMNR
jgi:hypothetical protein